MSAQSPLTVYLEPATSGARRVPPRSLVASALRYLHLTFDDRWHKRLTVANAEDGAGRPVTLVGPSVDMRPETLSTCGLQKVLSDARFNGLTILEIAEVEGMRAPLADSDQSHPLFDDHMTAFLRTPCEQCCAELQLHANTASILIPTEVGYRRGSRVDALTQLHSSVEEFKLPIETTGLNGTTSLHLRPPRPELGIRTQIEALGGGRGEHYERGQYPQLDRLLDAAISRLHFTARDVNEMVAAGLLADGTIIYGAALSALRKNLNRCGEPVILSTTRLLTTAGHGSNAQENTLLGIVAVRVPQNPLTHAKWEVVQPCGNCCSSTGIHATHVIDLVPDDTGGIAMQRAANLISHAGDFPELRRPPLSHPSLDALALMRDSGGLSRRA